MTGTLLKEDNQWFVKHFNGNEVIKYSIYSEDEIYCLDSDKFKDVEFEVVLDTNSPTFEPCATKLKMYENLIHFDTWNEIFAEIEGSLHVPLPLRVKNWLRNKYNSPTKTINKV